jgi:uncharacterized membrane-anchored protein
MKKYLLPIFILLVLVQWLVPGQLIWKKERILLTGKEFKFETEPVDPADPFRGRYISLNFKANIFTSLENLKSGEKIYVELDKDKNGFAKIKNVTSKLPTSGADFIEATVNYVEYVTPNVTGNTIHIEYPFEEYYLDEYKAPKAEELYRSSNRDNKQKTYAIVKVLNGDAVIKDVIINDRPLQDWFP